MNSIVLLTMRFDYTVWQISGVEKECDTSARYSIALVLRPNAHQMEFLLKNPPIKSYLIDIGPNWGS